MDRQIGKMNYLYANVRLIVRQQRSLSAWRAAPYVLKQTSDEGVFAAGLFKPGSSGDREAMGVGWRDDGGALLPPGKEGLVAGTGLESRL
jgi:hypothetical protein